MNMEQKGVNCTKGCSTIGMLNWFGSQFRSRTDAEVPKGDACNMFVKSQIFCLGEWFLVLSGNLAMVFSFKWDGPDSSEKS